MEWLTRLLRLTPILASFLLTCLAGLSYLPTKRLSDGPFLWAWKLSQSYRTELTLAAASLILSAQTLIEFLETRKSSRKSIQAIIDTLHKDYFGRVAASEKYKHRVTLFRHRRVLLSRWREELVLEVRSKLGTHGNSRTRFRVHDFEAYNEGVVGRAWYTNASVTEELPPWPPDSDNLEARRSYAQRGFLSLEKADKLHVKSEAISATCVRVKGKKWGVLVVDSMQPGVVSSQKERIINGYAELLGEVL